MTEEVTESVEWICNVCRYVYDPKKGDPERSIPPGTDFGDLPEDWVCPVCKASKGKFIDM